MDSSPPAVDTYTHGHADSVLRSHRWRTVANSAAYLAPHLIEGRSLLDVGCGPGTISVEFAQRLFPGRVLAVDAAPDIVATATESAPAGLDNLSFACLDGYDLDLADDSFDIVHAHQVLQHVSDPVAMLKEFRRVCKPDGIVAVRDADYAAMAWFPESPALDEWNTLYRQVARRNHAEPDAGRHLLGWAQEAGFTSIEPSADTWCFATAEDRAWWGSLWADRTLDSAFAAQAVDYGLATPADLERCSQGFRDWQANPAGWFAVVNAELLCRL